MFIQSLFNVSQRRCIHNSILYSKIGNFSVLITRQIGANTSMSQRECRLCIIGWYIKVSTAKHYTFKPAVTHPIGQWLETTLFARARVLFCVDKIDTSLKLSKLRQINVTLHIKLSDHEANISQCKWVAFQTSYMLCAWHRVKLNYNEDA